ncbi:MAG: hypothetical protein MJK15_03595 [Colwellia sp.]|nr:hypothetical protein [Colwellia sp.]
MKAFNCLLVATIIVMLLWTAKPEEILAKVELPGFSCSKIDEEYSNGK